MFRSTEPGGTDGGIKLTTFVMLMAVPDAALRGERDVSLTELGRRIAAKTAGKALSVLVLSLGWV